MNPWIVLLAITLVAVFYVVLPVGVATFAHYRRARRLRCPLAGVGASVDVNATRAAVSEVAGGRKLNVRDCSRWPRAWGCRQQCVEGDEAGDRATATASPASAQRPRTILVPLDGTPTGEAILPRVASLAREEGAHVRLMRVAPAPKAVWSGKRIVSYSDQEIARVELDEQAYLNTAVEHLPGVPVSEVVRFGAPVEKIVDEAEASGADLIVMGTHPRGFLERLRWRNIVAAVASATRIPLFRVPCGPTSR